MASQKIIHVVIVASVPNQNDDDSFSALADVVEMDIEFDRLSDFRTAAIEFSVGDTVVNGTRHVQEGK